MKKSIFPFFCPALTAQAFVSLCFTSIAPVLLLLSGPLLKAAEAGAWETFSSQSNADAWAAYDYSDEQVYTPQWNGAVSGEEDVYFYHTGDQGVWFYTGVADQAGGGVLVGDYTVDSVIGLRCDLEIDSLPDFDQVDCAVYTTGPEGVGYYYSDFFSSDDFSEGGWWTLDFSFGTPWYFYNGTEYVAVWVTEEFLMSIEEIGFRIFPKTGTTNEIYVAIDNVKLIPNLEGVKLTHSQTAPNIVFSYTPGRGIACSLQRMLTSPVIDWEDVVGHIGVTGTVEHTLTVPVSESEGFFRVKSEEYFTPFVTSS